MPEPSAPATRGRARGGDLAGLGAVAATYVFFLIWAQFGLLERMKNAGLDAAGIRTAMAAMGIAGLLASALAAKLQPGQRTVSLGLGACAATALASLGAASVPAFALAAAAVGAATAVTTVSLAAGIPALVGPSRRGLKVGGATGVAYLLCNVPLLFEAPPADQAMAAAALCLAAAAALGLSPERSAPPAPLPGAPAEASFRGLGWAALVASFLALVWLDSAAFAIIQQEETLRRMTWAEGDVKLLLGLVHLAAALAAGALADRGGLLALPPAAFVALAGAALALERLAGQGLAAGALYAAGVSLYSVPLVLAPAARLAGPGLGSPSRRAAQLYGVAGWLGSAAGVGMAQDLHRIPGAFLLAAGLLIALGAAAARPMAALGLARRFGPAAAIALAGGAAAAGWSGGPRAPAGEAGAVARGRAVYLAEGCVNCHSQFVRPASRDVALWGPARPLDRAAAPPLPGNRRQGPDLAEVGLRRNPVWNRLHLIDPRALSPHSRMPSYRHLFAPGDSRGDDLVAYLAALGAGDGADRLATIRSPASGAKAAASPDGARLFASLCSPCHGPAGRGDGPLAASFPAISIDLAKPKLFHVAERAPGEPDPEGLARVIRWGAPGTAMAGHETLPDGEVEALVAQVLALRRRAAAAEARP